MPNNASTERGKRAPKGVMPRLIRTVFSFYPVLLPVTIGCILINAIVSSMPSVFMQNAIAVVEATYKTGDWASASGTIFRLLAILITLYVISLAAGATFNQLMAIITQGTLAKLREKMFDHMQDLPIRYFDTHSHGDIMSFYTNDIDTLRQLISQSLPQLMISGITLLSVFCIMIYYSIWLALVVLCGVVVMFFTARYVSGHSSKYFLQQQITIAKTEGFMEEMMSGQKVIKVFCHEEGAKADFDKVNDELFENSEKANRFANILMPLLGNMGNVTYVVVALVGGALLLNGAPNLSLSGMALSISIVVPFLNMTKQFAGAIGQVSNQVNMVVMGLAGAHRIFALLDESPRPTRATSPWSTPARRPTARWRSTPSGPTSGPGSTPTTTAPSPTPACRATSASTTWTSATTPKRRCCTIFRCTPSLARRWPSSAPPAPARPPSPTSSTASTTSRTARSATTASTSARSRKPTCAVRWASCCRTPTCSPAP